MHAPEEIQIGGLTDSSDVCDNHPMSNTHTPQDETSYHRCGAAITDDNAMYACVIELDDPNEDGNWWKVCVDHDTLIETVEVRHATVDAKNVGWGSDPCHVVSAYLPDNYQASRHTNSETDIIKIVGYDHAGWTLDGYVIPRLASAMIFATEIK